MLGTRPLPIATDRIAKMADIACEMLRLAVDAYLRQDPQVAATLVERDREVDALRNDTDRGTDRGDGDDPAVVSPALALIFVVQSIERVGDHATNISEYVVTVVDGTDARHSTRRHSRRRTATSNLTPSGRACRATSQMPSSDTAMPSKASGDSDSPNIGQAITAVTAGTRYM